MENYQDGLSFEIQSKQECKVAYGSLNLFLELVLINVCILRIMLTTVPEILVKKLKKKFKFKIVFVIFQ
jgi:hypothetical protein